MNKKKSSFWIIILFLIFNSLVGNLINPTFHADLVSTDAKIIPKENKIENIGLIQRDYLADGTVFEKAQGLILEEDSTPGVEEGDNPLGVEQMRFLGINEIAFVCPGLTNNFANLSILDIKLIENQINDHDFETMLDADCSYEGNESQATDAASGDVNGDDKDELVIISKYGRVYIYEYNTSTRVFTQQVYNLDIINYDKDRHYSISLNQFNTDPGLEIAIGIGYQDKIQIWDPVNEFGTYYTPGARDSISGVDGGIAEVDLYTLLGKSVELMDIETGDFNGNGDMDIVGLGYYGDLFVVELNLGVLELIGERIALSDNAQQGYPHNFPQAIGIGDYNGDFLPDIAVMKCILGNTAGFNFYRNYYVDTIYWKGFDCNGTVLNNLTEVDVSAYNCFYPSIGMGDIDGDGLCETIVSGKIDCELNTDSWVVMIFEDFAHKLTGPKATFIGETQCPWAAKSFACTDVDLDGVDEICFSSVERYGNLWYASGVGAYLEQPRGRHTSIVKFNSNANPWEATVLHPDEDIIGFPVIGDYDGDGIVVEYSGNHYPRFTPQMPIFVLAAPPTYFDLNGDGSGSSVSTSQSTTTDVSEQFSVMAGIKVSYEAGFEIFGQGAKFRASLEANYQFTQTRTNMESETIGIQYSSGYEDNQIIYNVVDYESYIYNIVKHPFNDLIGKNMSLDIPIRVNIYSTTESLYENSGKGTNIIGLETYNHVVGQPGTYPTLEELNEYTGVEKILEKTVVPQGSSAHCGTTLSYIREEASSVEKEYSMQLTFSTGGEVGGFGLDVSVGYGHSWANKVTYGKSMAYDGSVSCIGDESSWSKNKYSWGMFIQNIEPDEGFSFQLIHYYTEGNFTYGLLDKITDFISEYPVQTIAIGVGIIGVITSIIIIAKRKGRGKT